MTDAMSTFIPALLEMLKNPPDLNAPVPIPNRRETVFGVTLPFHILSWIAVAFRLHTRLRVVREPGLDDAFVVLAAVLNLIVHASFYRGMYAGFGQHILYLVGDIEPTMIWFYISNGAYTTTTIVIKLSLLFQYLRLFREGYRRISTLVLLAAVTLWGLAFIFMAWFPCFPVSGFWDKTMVPQAKCYGFGFRTVPEVKGTLFAFAGTNMGLDIAILLLPLTEYFRPGLKQRQVFAMTGLFALGFIVVIMAILRLWSGLKYNSTTTMYDFTWWWPEVLIFSCLEVNFAIMCASMPIFWPTVMAAWTQISVTHEVTVTHDRNSRYVEHGTYPMELQRTVSTKSHESTEGLTLSTSRGDKAWDEGFEPPVGAGVTKVEVRPGEQKSRVL